MWKFKTAKANETESTIPARQVIPEHPAVFAKSRARADPRQLPITQLSTQLMMHELFLVAALQVAFGTRGMSQENYWYTFVISLSTSSYRINATSPELSSSKDLMTETILFVDLMQHIF